MLYVNGIAIGVIELKRSTVSVGEGIRQNLSSQERHFHPALLHDRAKLVMTGNDSQRLRYGVTGTPEQHWLRWQEAHASGDGEDSPLLRELAHTLRTRTSA